MLQEAKQCASDDFYSPTPSPAWNRVADLIAVCRGWPINNADVTTVCIKADLRDVVYTQPPDGWRRDSWVWRLCKQISGTRIGAATWMDHVTKVTQGMDMFASKGDLCMFCNKQGTFFMTKHVDDIHATRHEDMMTRVFQDMKQQIILKVDPYLVDGG